MKTRFNALSALAVAAIAFFGCDKVEQSIHSDNTGIPFEFIASSVGDKTTNDGVHTKWASGDKVNLFHAVAGQTTYVSDGAFTAGSSGASVTFSGSLAESLTADNYDWLAIYPQNNNIETPANTGTKGYVTIGSSYTGSQAQTGNDSKAHLAGIGYPVAGKVTNVAKATKPSISMSLLSSVIAVHVTNGTDNPITVSEVSFTGTEDIVGHFFIDFTGPSVVYTPRTSNVSSTASLNVTSGSTIAKGGAATFYLAVKPFTAPASGTISLSVTADNGTQVRNKVLASAANFVAGTINTLNFTYDKAAPTLSEPSAVTGWYRVENPAWLNANDRVVIVNEAGTKSMSKVQKTNNRDGVDITVSDVGDYKHITAFNDDTQVFILETGSVSGSFAFWCENGEEASKYIYAASSTSNHLKSQNSINDNASFIATLPLGVGNLTAQGTNTHKVIQFNSSLFSCYESAAYASISIYKYYGAWTGSTTCADPTITQDGSTVTISCATPGVKIYYTTDGSTPTTASTLYAAPFVIASPLTVKAIAVRSHYTNSGVSSKTCTLKVSTPVIDCSGTAFTITCATDGATIYYETSTTSMGAVETPTTSSSPFSSAVAIAATTYVKAFAVKDGYDNSDVASETCVYVSGSSSTTFVFNTSVGLTALGIVAPETGKGTDLDPEKDYISGAITMNVTHGGTNTRIWNSSGTLSLRVYKANGAKPDGTIIFDAGTGKTITKIEFTASSLTATASVGTLSDKTWTGSSQAVTFTCTANSTISTIKVTYSEQSCFFF